MKKEALRRMRKLNLSKATINDFDVKGKICMSICGDVYPISEKIRAEVDKFRQSTNDLVYHVIVTCVLSYTHVSILFVSEDKTQ